jgi:hypothetical protein
MSSAKKPPVVLDMAFGGLLVRICFGEDEPFAECEHDVPTLKDPIATLVYGPASEFPKIGMSESLLMLRQDLARYSRRWLLKRS